MGLDISTIFETFHHMFRPLTYFVFSTLHDPCLLEEKKEKCRFYFSPLIIQTRSDLHMKRKWAAAPVTNMRSNLNLSLLLM